MSKVFLRSLFVRPKSLAGLLLAVATGVGGGNLAHAQDQELAREARSKGVVAPFGQLLARARSVAGLNTKLLDAKMAKRGNSVQVDMYLRTFGGDVVTVRLDGQDGRVLSVKRPSRTDRPGEGSGGGFFQRLFGGSGQARFKAARSSDDRRPAPPSDAGPRSGRDDREDDSDDDHSEPDRDEREERSDRPDHSDRPDRDDRSDPPDRSDREESREDRGEGRR